MRTANLSVGDGQMKENFNRYRGWRLPHAIASLSTTQFVGLNKNLLRPTDRWRA